MLIEANALKHWMDHFYGYGSWRAKIWFVSHEEGGGDLPEDIADRLTYFQREHASATDATLCDIRKIYREIAIRWEGPKASTFKNYFEHRFDNDAVLHGVWKNIIAFASGYRNEDLPDLLAYQKNLLASPSAQAEAMIKLYPLPAPHNHGWYYSWLDLPQFGFLKSRALYEQHQYESRVQSILKNIATYKPELVLMYGMNNINLLKTSIQEFFPQAKFTMIKATKQRIPQHHRADLNGTLILITTQIPALRHRRVETGFDWLEFGRSITTG